MTSIKTSLTFLNFNQEVVVSTSGTESTNLSISQTKNYQLYSKEKHIYLNKKVAKSRNFQKLSETSHELEQLFLSYRCLHLQWEAQDTVLLFFNSGIIASVTFDEKKLSIQKVIIDNSLCGKLVSDHITDIILNEKLLLICYSEPKLTYVRIGKAFPTFPSKVLGQKKGKILGFDPKLTTVDVIGPSSRRLEKKLSLNNLKDCVLIWWRFTSSDVWPWMPVNYSVDRVNMLLYALNDSSVEVLCSAKVHGELVHATFSKWHSNRILTLEEIIDDSKHFVNICCYEIICGKCQCTSLSKLPLHGHLSAFDWSLLEDKLLLCDNENYLLIYDVNKNVTLVARTLFIAKEVAWHPSGVLAIVAGSHGCLQCFDAALTVVRLQLYGEEFESTDVINLSKLLYPQRLVQSILWQSSNSKSSIFGASDAFNVVSTTVLVYFEHGTFVLVNFSLGCLTKNILSPLELISQYLKCGSINEAVCLLQSLNWCQQTELCYQCLSKIVNFLLRKQMNSQVEVALEHSLGTFYNSANSLTPNILYDYHQQIDDIARRFFHVLLRYHRFEKAFLLAIDLQFRDLFLDLHHVAKQKNETMLAVVSLKHAQELGTSDSSSCDQSDAFEKSNCSSSSSSSPVQKESFLIDNTSHHIDSESGRNSPATTDHKFEALTSVIPANDKANSHKEYEQDLYKYFLKKNMENQQCTYISKKSYSILSSNNVHRNSSDEIAGTSGNFIPKHSADVPAVMSSSNNDEFSTSQEYEGSACNYFLNTNFENQEHLHSSRKPRPKPFNDILVSNSNLNELTNSSNNINSGYDTKISALSSYFNDKDHAYRERKQNFKSVSNSSLYRNSGNQESTYFYSKSHHIISSDVSLPNCDEQGCSSNKITSQPCIIDAIDKLSLLRDCDSRHPHNSAIKNHSPLHSDSFEEDEETVGEKKVKFVHFGIV